MRADSFETRQTRVRRTRQSVASDAFQTVSDGFWSETRQTRVRRTMSDASDEFQTVSNGFFGLKRVRRA